METSIEPQNPSLLEFTNVTVMRGARTALHDITLRIAAGEHVCILGPNGCGKSTLIKTITRECYPLASENSRILLFGKAQWNIFELRSLLGIVSPDLLASCTSDATGLDVVLSGFFGSTRIFTHHQIEPDLVARAQSSLARLNALHLAARPVAELSSGEAKRVLLARALVHDPKTLLFDEPGTALDVEAQRHLQETMRNLAQQGIGILLVTHHISDIIPEIDRIIFLQEGRILADGSKTELLTEKRLANLFGVPVRIARQDGFFHLW
ncbi:MAG TPA: ATP-binding cassette domain-containing protein [Candidatus Acidoferrales bacterium]